MLVFLYHCISDGNQLSSENVGFHLAYKAAFVSGALFYVQHYSGNLALHCALLMTSRWQVINLHIYAATNSVSLWDYGIHKFNCITVSVQVML